MAKPADAQQEEIEMNATKIARGGVSIFMFLVFLSLAAGWCLNLFKIVVAFSEPLTTLGALRILGIPVIPLGMLLGWL